MSTSAGVRNEDAAAATSIPRRCAACKHLRRKCTRDCILAPHFPASEPRRYACVQRFFGAGNVSRMLQGLPVEERARAADAMEEEAHRRAKDPVYGCTGAINRLQEEINALQCELARTRAQIAMHQHARPPPLPPAAAAQPPLQLQQDDDSCSRTTNTWRHEGLDDLLSDL